MSDSTVAIDSLRICGTRGNASEVASRRIESLLSATSWSDLGLGPTSVLCIRKMRDPLPYVLPLDGRSIHPPQRWQIALTRDLNRIAQTAARPARGVVPLDAEAVVFEDKAQALACFLGDFVEGTVCQRWWWSSLMDGHALARPLDGVVRDWFEEPILLPATIALLQSHQRLRIAALLHENIAKALLRVLSFCFGLPLPDSWVEQGRSPGASASAAEPTETNPSELLRSDRDFPQPQARSPQTSGSQTETGERNPPHVEFSEPNATFPGPVSHPAHPTGRNIETSATSHRSQPHSTDTELQMDEPDWNSTSTSPVEQPSRTSSTATTDRSEPWAWAAAARALGDPWRGLLTDEEVASLPPWSEALLGVALCAACAPVALRDPAWKGAVQQRLTHRLGLATPPDQKGLVSELPSEVRRVQPERSSGQAPVSLDRTPRRGEAPASEVARAAGLQVTTQAWTVDSRELERYVPVTLAGHKVRTELAGLFYLVNVALYLELYSDFTNPLDEGLPLPIWDFIDLVGNALLGSEHHPDDPLWVLLADLAGRPPDVAAGSGFVPPANWQMPVDWLAQLPHEAHARALAATDPEPAPLPLTEAPLARWVTRVSEYICCCLRFALGLDGDQAVAPILCAQPGIVVVTSTHVDILFSLADLPIAIRLAGLDRDPGFVPSAGRSIRFFYQ